MDELLEKESHAEETLGGGNQIELNFQLESQVKENPIEETMEDENQLGDTILMKTPEDWTHTEEDPENDNH